MIITSFIGSVFLLLFHFIVILPIHDQITHIFYYMKLPPPWAFPRVSGEHGTSEKRKKQMLRMSAEGRLFLGSLKYPPKSDCNRLGNEAVC